MSGGHIPCQTRAAARRDRPRKQILGHCLGGVRLPFEEPGRECGSGGCYGTPAKITPALNSSCPATGSCYGTIGSRSANRLPRPPAWRRRHRAGRPGPLPVFVCDRNRLGLTASRCKQTIVLPARSSLVATV